MACLEGSLAWRGAADKDGGVFQRLRQVWPRATQRLREARRTDSAADGPFHRNEAYALPDNDPGSPSGILWTLYMQSPMA